VKEIHFPHSLGLLYSAFTYYTGFKVNSGEYKVMGLAPYGTPRFAQLIYDHLIDLKPDGSFRLEAKAGRMTLIVLTPPSPTTKPGLVLEGGKTLDVGSVTVAAKPPAPPEKRERLTQRGHDSHEKGATP